MIICCTVMVVLNVVKYHTSGTFTDTIPTESTATKSTSTPDESTLTPAESSSTPAESTLTQAESTPTNSTLNPTKSILSRTSQPKLISILSNGKIMNEKLHYKIQS